jgi:hypothetical protein
MESGEGTPFQELFNEIEQERDALREEARALPRSYEEYMQMSVEERMGVATEVFRAFTPHLTEPLSYPDDSKQPFRYGTAWIEPEDRPGMRIRGTIGYVVPKGEGKFIPRLEVYAQAYLEPGGGRHSRPVFLGAVKYGPYGPAVDKSAEDSWYVQGEERDDRHTLDSPTGQRAVEFIDDAMRCQYPILIAGYSVYLGTKALEGIATGAAEAGQA